LIGSRVGDPAVVVISPAAQRFLLGRCRRRPRDGADPARPHRHSGIRQLQEAFGAPRLDDGVFPVTRRKILQERTTLGYLFGDRWLDGGSAIVAIVTLLPIWPIWGTRIWLDTLVLFASGYQVAGWVATMQFQRRR